MWVNISYLQNYLREQVDNEDKFMRSTRDNEIGKLFSSLNGVAKNIFWINH